MKERNLWLYMHFRCERVNCTAFVVDFGKRICYAIEAKEDELIPDPNSTFYHRVCVRGRRVRSPSNDYSSIVIFCFQLVPISCTRHRLWQVERSPGAVLIDSSALHLPNPITRNQCYEKCIETGKIHWVWIIFDECQTSPRFFLGGSCESAQFRTSKPLSSDETALGRCSLSLYERGTRPRAYRASMYRDEYLRDQCRNLCEYKFQKKCFRKSNRITSPFVLLQLIANTVRMQNFKMFLCHIRTSLYQILTRSK